VTGGQGPQNQDNPGVHPPSSTPYGKTYGEWAAAWWQWVLAIPASRNPMVDTTGEHGGENQSGPVWFLAATGGSGTFERTCTVPVGKGLLVPIMPWVAAIPEDGTTDDQIRRGNTAMVDAITEVEAAVDGVQLTGLWSHRFQSPFFEFTAPPPEQAWAPDYAGTHRAIASGFWFMLEPLPPGSHKIHLRAKAVFPAVYPNVGVLEGEVTYHLTVE